MTLIGNIEGSLQIPKELNSMSLAIDGGRHCFTFEHMILPLSLGGIACKSHQNFHNCLLGWLDPEIFIDKSLGVLQCLFL